MYECVPWSRLWLLLRVLMGRRTMAGCFIVAYRSSLLKSKSGPPEGQNFELVHASERVLCDGDGPIDLDFIAGAGSASCNRRFVEIGNPVAFSALTEAD